MEIRKIFVLPGYAVLACCLCSCVMVERYTYIDLAADCVSTDETDLITYDGHIGSRGPIPMRYSIHTEDWTAFFLRDPDDVRGGLAITAISRSGEQLALQITERSLNVPHYGPCLHYSYASAEFKQIDFYDLCPDSIQRDFVIAFEVFLNDEVAQRLEVRYKIRKQGFWWAADGL